MRSRCRGITRRWSSDHRTRCIGRKPSNLDLGRRAGAGGVYSALGSSPPSPPDGRARRSRSSSSCSAPRTRRGWSTTANATTTYLVAHEARAAGTSPQLGGHATAGPVGVRQQHRPRVDSRQAGEAGRVGALRHRQGRRHFPVPAPCGARASRDRDELVVVRHRVRSGRQDRQERSLDGPCQILARTAQANPGLRLVRHLQNRLGRKNKNVVDHAIASASRYFKEYTGIKNTAGNWFASEVKAFHARLWAGSRLRGERRLARLHDSTPPASSSR